jgi:rubrerythrin
MMDLSMFNLDELLRAALKSEVDSKTVYTKLANRVNNYLLKDKLEFLANEEEEHRRIIEDIFKNHFPNEKIKLPQETPIPLPEVKISTDDIPLSKILRNAMDAEQAAHEFYTSLATRFPEGSKLHNTLLYFASMEQGHYKLLEIETDSMERFEEADEYWPMMHVGP